MIENCVTSFINDLIDKMLKITSWHKVNSHSQTDVIGKKYSFNFVAIKSAYKISL